jgi:hypothetical protein
VLWPHHDFSSSEYFGGLIVFLSLVNTLGIKNITLLGINIIYCICTQITQCDYKTHQLQLLPRKLSSWTNDNMKQPRRFRQQTDKRLAVAWQYVLFIARRWHRTTWAFQHLSACGKKHNTFSYSVIERNCVAKYDNRKSLKRSDSIVSKYRRSASEFGQYQYILEYEWLLNIR